MTSTLAELAGQAAQQLREREAYDRRLQELLGRVDQRLQALGGPPLARRLTSMSPEQRLEVCVVGALLLQVLTPVQCHELSESGLLQLAARPHA